MLKAFDESMPEAERLGAFLDAEVIPVSELKLGDEVWQHASMSIEGTRQSGMASST